MTDASLITQVWPNWSVTELIGSGTHGSVYAVRRDDVPDMEAAVKVIPIPMNPAETVELLNEGFTDEEIIEFFRKETEDRTSEIQMMKKYQGMSHFVCLEDYQVITRQDGSLGFWILIRMEKLQSLPSWICDKTLTEKEIIDLGIQLCEALTDCHADHIIHRDIKPANIFVKDHSDSGFIYKLGDFGVSRKIEGVSASLSMRGAPGYMAPEVIMGIPYDERADIYSLGITLYKLLNDNRFPFMPNRRLFTREDYALAQREKMSGAKLPPAANASSAMNDVLQKACAFDPADRYPSARTLSEALRLALDGYSEKSGAHPRSSKPFPKALPWGMGACAVLIILILLWLALQHIPAVSPPAATEIPLITVADHRLRDPCPSPTLSQAIMTLSDQWKQLMASDAFRPETAIETLKTFLPIEELLALAPPITFDASSEAVYTDDSADSWYFLMYDANDQLFGCVYVPEQGAYLPDAMDGLRTKEVSAIGIRVHCPAGRQYLQLMYWYSPDPVPVLTRMEIILEQNASSLPFFFCKLFLSDSGSRCVMQVSFPYSPVQEAEYAWPDGTPTRQPPVT